MKDNREIRQGIRTLVDDSNKDKPPVAARVLGGDPNNYDKDLDEVAGMYSQEQLDTMVDNGVLENDWKASGSAKQESSSKQESEKK